MLKICKKRVHENYKNNLPWAFKNIYCVKTKILHIFDVYKCNNTPLKSASKMCNILISTQWNIAT